MRFSWLVGVLAVVLMASMADASVTGMTCAQDYDGALEYCTVNPGTYTYDSVTDYAMYIDEKVKSGPSHVAGEITTNTEQDPAVWVIKTIENDTTTAWSGYTFNVFMDQPFALQTAFVTPDNWSASATAVGGPGTYYDVHNHAWNYKGVVTFVPNTPADKIAVGSEGDFGAKLSFSGSLVYNYEVEQVPVPEPATIALVVLGGCGFLFARRARA
jgi:hypothetical protein